MKSYLLSIAYLALAISLVGCGENDETPDGRTQQMTANIDGQAFKAVQEAGNPLDFDLIEAELVEMGTTAGFVLFWGGVDLNWDNAAAVDIGLIIMGPDFDALEAGTTLGSRGSESDPPVLTYTAAGSTQMMSANGETIYSAVTDDHGEIELTVTAIDRGAKSISGTFSFTAYDPDEEITVVVTNGEFKNISWAD